MTLGSSNQLALLPFSDCFFGGTALVRSRSYPSDSEPDLYSPFEPCENRRPLSNVALRLQDPLLRCDRDLGWNIDWAVAFFVDHLEQTWKDAAETLRNIRIRAQSLEDDGLRKEIPYRIFNKLDEVLFAGHLKNAVFLNIGSWGSDVSGATYTHRLGPDPDVKRISIVLNGDVLVRQRDVVAVLIHHMIHAYFLVACGGQKEDEVEYGRLSHDVHFGKLMFTIKRLSAVHGRELTPLDYGHNSSKLRYLDGKYYRPQRRDTPDQEDRAAWYCSHCHFNVQGPSGREVEKWYDKVCKPLFSQPNSVREPQVQTYNQRCHSLDTTRRAALPPSAKSVEFLFQDRPILVSAAKLDEYLSIAKAFSKAGEGGAGTRFLKLHDSTSQDTLMRFLEFLHTGSYRPEYYPFSITATERRAGAAAAPIIKPQASTTAAAASESPILLADVQFAKFATLMSFDECKTYALSRLNTHTTCHEDPVALLVEIYSGCEPDSHLKNWARQFLVAAPSAHPGGGGLEAYQHYYHHPSSGSSSTGTNSLLEPPNLIKLECEALPYRARFLAAVAASGALENEVEKARKELKANEWYDYSSPLTSLSTLRLHLNNESTAAAAAAAAGFFLEPTYRRRTPPPPLPPLVLDSSSCSSCSSSSPSSSSCHNPHHPHHYHHHQHHHPQIPRDRYPDLLDQEQQRLKALRREKERELMREKEKVRRLEREKERVRETKEALEIKAAKEALLDRLKFECEY
ncbi:hypothetical protein GMOD_00005690 [Pyrenophora seminiperda CCB06]|uniref:Uncharacterized protein n=1 Tax=Pyrenophora seminiperda CCB06 TaxID=1302712 RepID=A0A3M7M9H5_9PLEO|nr:hypothetical protein GMOD_00005690 [Pyrenophora seminiperda CCB06]